nr:peptide ABC transporter substrate-binding protein [Lachnospiraceae bacterium]
MKKKIVSLVLASVMAIGLMACGGGSTGASTDGAADGGSDAATEATGGSGSDLNIMLETPVESLDPQEATDGTSFEVIADFTDGLMQMDEDGQAVNAIAESYELSDDDLTWTFKLREDAVWSNGTPVTAADFVFGWQRAVDPAVA